MFAGRRLLLADCCSVCVVCWLLRLSVRCSLFVVCCLLLLGCCLLCVACRVLLVGGFAERCCCLVYAVCCCVMNVVCRCLLCVVRRLWLVVRCSMFVVCCLVCDGSSFVGCGLSCAVVRVLVVTCCSSCVVR